MSRHSPVETALTHLSGRSGQEVVNLLVNRFGPLEILNTANLSLNQVVTVDGGWDSSCVHACRHELEDRHLCDVTSAGEALEDSSGTDLGSGILASDALWGNGTQ